MPREQTLAPPKPNWWIDLITSTHRDARDQWERMREMGDNVRLEDDEYRSLNPPPTLKSVMLGLAGINDPEHNLIPT